MGKSRTSSPRTRALTSEQLGRFGEKAFQAVCAEAKLVAHRPEYDINGWDFFVEFPHIPPDQDTDLINREMPSKCFVQVKTVWQGAREVNLGLSPAERLAKMALPSFICIIEVFDDVSVRTLHVIHVSGELLERILYRLRQLQSERQSTLINKTDFRLKVPKLATCPNPNGAYLADAIQAYVGSDVISYINEKASSIASCGFKANRLSGTLSVLARDRREYSDFLVGLQALPVVDFAAVETRWDIPTPVQLEATPVSVQFIPNPREVEVVWRRVDAVGSVRFRMISYYAGNTTNPGTVGRVRLVHPNLEINIEDGEFRVTDKGFREVETSYQTLKQLSKFEDFISCGGCALQVFYNGRLMVEWHSQDAVEVRPKSERDAISDLVRALGNIIAAADLQDVELPSGSWKNWYQQVHDLDAILTFPEHATMSLPIEGSQLAEFDGREDEAVYINIVQFPKYLLAYYATCTARVEMDRSSGSLQIAATAFSVREVRKIQKSYDAVKLFADEAKAATGLTTSFALAEFQVA